MINKYEIEYKIICKFWLRIVMFELKMNMIYVQNRKHKHTICKDLIAC